VDDRTGPLTVAICSPQPIVRAGMEALLRQHPDRFEVLPPQWRTGADPAVVLYDVMVLSDQDDAELVHLVQRTRSKVLAVGRDLRPDLVSRALAVGVDGFFSVGVDEAGLVAAVESAGTGWEEGDRGENPTVGSSRSAARAQQLGADVGLTPRERETLACVARGLTNQQIADHYYLSINSVKTYLRAAYRKIGVASRGEAVGWAIRHGVDSNPDREPAVQRGPR
jgi:DNA-binding NarL/FixJ family response regulator